MASVILDQGLGLDGMQVGGAYTANPASNSSIYWNPANLVNLRSSQLYLSYSSYIEDLSTITGMFNMNLSKNLAFGIAYLGLQVNALDYRGNVGQSLGAPFNYRNDAYVLGLGYQLIPGLSIGSSYKVFTQKALAEKNYQSIDIACKILLFTGTHIGLVGENIVVVNGTNELYPKYRLGLEQEFFGIKASMDLIYDWLSEHTYTNYGFVFTGLPFVSLKGGMNGYFEKYFLGISLKMDLLSIDYMFSDPELGAVHRFGLGITL